MYTYELVTYLLMLVVLPGFLVQFGISYSVDRELKKFARQTIPDDPHRPDLRQVNNMSVCVCVRFVKLIHFIGTSYCGFRLKFFSFICVFSRNACCK